MGDVYGPAQGGLWVYSQYSKSKYREMQEVTDALKATNPQDAARINELNNKIFLLNNAITFASDVVASLILSASKMPT